METPVRAARRQTRVEEWALVLAAASIPHRVERDGAGFLLIVPDADALQAQAALDAYDEEARAERHAALAEQASARPVPAPAGSSTAPPPRGSSWAGSRGGR